MLARQSAMGVRVSIGAVTRRRRVFAEVIIRVEQLRK